MKRLQVLLLLVGLLVLTGSIGLNVILVKRGIREFRATQNLRLDPLAANRFEKANRELGAPDEDRPRLVLLGDSRIAQWDPLPAVEPAEVVGRGVGGETTAQVALRTRRDAIDLGARVVVIQAGINDLKTIGVAPGRAKALEETTYGNLERISRELSGAGVRVFLLTIFPPGKVDLGRRLIWSDEIEKSVERVNARLRDLEIPGVEVIDCDPVLAGEGRLAPEFSADTLHLNTAGYRALGAALEKKLKAALPGERDS